MRRPAAALVVLALAGCGDQRRAEPAPAPTPKPPTDRELIGRALERRADRVPDGLGIRGSRYRLERLAVRGDRARVTARLSYAVAGVEGDFGSSRTFRARRRGGRWRLRVVRRERDREPWQVDDYVRTRTDHFVVLTPKDLTPPVEALEAGYARLTEVLRGGRLERRYLVVIARDGDRARRLTRRIAGLESLTALTDTQVRVRGPALRVVEVGSQRLVVNLPVFLAQRDPGRVVAHELTHAALAPVTSGRVPAWLIEGVALYVSGDDRRDEHGALPTVPTLAELSAPDALTLSSGSAQRSGYATASAAAYAIAERSGPRALLELLQGYSRRSLRGRAGDPALTDRALRRVLGTTLDELQRSLP